MSLTHPMTAAEQGRFDEKYVPVPYCGCWLWDAAVNSNGYGNFWDGTRVVKAHRVALATHLGRPLRADEKVLHSCDVPACVNPDHLSVGSQAENLKDMSEKGRSTQGERHPGAKLTRENVLRLRELRGESDLTYQELGAIFGVAGNTAHRAVTGRSWAHVAREEESK